MTDQLPAQPEPSSCPWCGAAAPHEATTCRDCGAALAQRESIGELRIPGLTSVDPALEDFDKRPLQLRGPSPSQGVAPALIVGAMAGGPIGLMAIGGVAAVAGAEFLGTRVGGPGGTRLEDLGKPSAVALQALERVHARDRAHPGEPGEPGEPELLAAEASREPDAAAAENGMSIWRDLPAGAGDAGDGPNRGSV